jgi:quercetin dioxygenase-like cupin family protein
LKDETRDVRPIKKTETCQHHHAQYVISGRLMLRMDDGTEMELKPGDFVVIPAGHTSWVVSDEPYTAIDFCTK